MYTDEAEKPFQGRCSKKRSVSYGMFSRWKKELDVECKTMSWLEWEMMLISIFLLARLIQTMVKQRAFHFKIRISGYVLSSQKMETTVHVNIFQIEVVAVLVTVFYSVSCCCCL